MCRRPGSDRQWDWQSCWRRPRLVSCRRSRHRWLCRRRVKTPAALTYESEHAVVRSHSDQVEFAVAVDIGSNNAVRAGIERAAVRSPIGPAVSEAAGAIAQVDVDFRVAACGVRRPYGNVEQVVAIEVAHGDRFRKEVRCSDIERDGRLECAIPVAQDHVQTGTGINVDGIEFAVPVEIPGSDGYG